MKYSSGRSRIKKEDGETAFRAAETGRGSGFGERVLLFCGILAVALTLAVPMEQGQKRADRGERIPVSGDVVAVMSASVRDRDPQKDPPENGREEEPVSAEAGESVYDGIGRFFARLLTGG